MMPRINNVFLGLAIGAVLSMIFVGGFITGSVFERQRASQALTSDRNLNDFLTAYHLVTQRSYYRPFNRHRLVDTAINAMLAATGDPHTLFLSPTQNQDASQQMNGSSFSGIGAMVAPVHDGLEIVAPLPNTPSSRAGIQAGDVVTKINGQSVASMTSDAAIARIHGKTGSKVRLTLTRRHAKPFTVSITREEIPPITAYGRMLSHRLGYLDIMSFGDTTASDVTQALHLLQDEHARALIIDLRDNPGGYVDAAQQIVSHFLTHGVVAYEQSPNKHLQALPVLQGESMVRVPVAILINSNTASAAEITAGALRDSDHAELIGTRSYGKGSMQSVYSLADGSSIRITDRLWLTPLKHSIQGTGLRPNLEVPVTARDSAAGKDPQLAAAERYLLHHTHA